MQIQEAVAVFLPRVFLGILFMYQGADALFKVKVGVAISAFSPALTQKGVPKFLVNAGAYFNTYTEFFCGIALIIGFAKYYALLLLAANILLASLAFSIMKPMWDLQFVFPRLVLIVYLLVVPASWDVFALDYLFPVLTSF